MQEVPFTKKLLRSYTFFAAVSVAIYTPIIYLLGIYDVAYYSALLVIFMLVSYGLTFNNQYNLSRIIFFSSIALVIVASITSKRYLNGVSLYIFPLMAYTFVLTLSNEGKFRRQISLIVFTSFLLIIILISLKSNIIFTTEYKIFYLLNFILSFLLLSFLLGIIAFKNYRKEKALQENQANIQTIIETIPQLVIQVDKDYTIRTLNNRFAAIVKNLFEKKLEEGASIFEFTFDEDIDRVKKAIDLAFNGQQTIVEKKIRLKNDNNFWIQIHYMPVVIQNTIQSVLLIISDQTEYKNLLINSNKLAAIAEESPIPIFEIDYNGKIKYANQPFNSTFGLNKDHYIPHEWMDFCIGAFDNKSEESEIKYQNCYYKFVAKKDATEETLRVYVLDISLIVEKNHQLESQKEFYESVMNIIPSDVVVFDDKKRYKFVNKYAIKDDKRREWIIGKTDAEYFEIRNLPFEILKLREEKKQQAIESGQQIEWIETFTERGEQKFFLRRIKPFFNKNSQLEFILGYGTDITSQKKAEIEVEKQKKLYREILNNLPISVFLKTLEGRYLFGNEKTLKYIGIQEKDFIGKLDNDIYPSNLADQYRSSDISAVEKGEFTFEEKLDTPWGTEYIMGGKKIIKADENESLILGYSLDVTDKVFFQYELKKQTELIQKILDISPTLIYIKKADGSIYMANQATAKMFGYDSPNEILYKTPDELAIQQEELAIWKLHDKKVLESDELHIFEETFTNKEGQVSWYLTHKIPFKIDEENCILGVGVDITQIKNIQSELLELNRRAKEASYAKSRFLSNMSHEIRTPLNAIIGFGQLMMEEPLEGKVAEFTRTILFSAQNLLNLINDILDFSKLQEGKFSKNIVSFNLNKFIHNIESIFKLKAREKNIYFTIQRDYDPDLIIQTDNTILSQILNNLLSNAIKFTKTGGVKMKVFISEPDILSIEIHDTGIGISEQFKSKIFNTFEQENSHISREFGGTGLGLAITRNFVELLEGTIHFESTLGIGTIFYVSIPIKILEFTGSKNNEKEENVFNSDDFGYSEGHAKYSILVVEDNPVNQRLMVTILNRYGFDIDVAVNGSEALVKVAQKRFNLILMDLHMPEVDGFKATECIRNNTSYLTPHDVPIVAVTADVLPETIERCQAIGFDDLIKKPMDISKITELLKKLVNDEFTKK